MTKINLKGKYIRLYYDSDLDGAITALLVKVFSGAKIVEYVPCSAGTQRKRKLAGVTDVFVDCRPANADSDIIRIDHHFGDYDTGEYLKNENIIVVDSPSAVRVAAIVFGAKINERILEEMDKVDAGKTHAFIRFTMLDDTLTKIVKNGTKRHFEDWETFRAFILQHMGEGMDMPGLADESVLEQLLQTKYGIKLEEIKKRGKPLVKILYTPVNGKKTFTLPAAEFFGPINNGIIKGYREKLQAEGVICYVVVGFYSATNRDGSENTAPYQVFVSRTPESKGVHLGNAITQIVGACRQTNGGGHPSGEVAGSNSETLNEAKKVLAFLSEKIQKEA
ncbi:hypothetical protein ACFLZN_00440 [Nanoarchaeota archaeon]